MQIGQSEKGYKEKDMYLPQREFRSINPEGLHGGGVLQMPRQTGSEELVVAMGSCGTSTDKGQRHMNPNNSKSA